MQRHRLEFREGFDVVAATARSQAAVMVLAPGDATGGPNNRHPESDQWLYVIQGDGRAIVGGEEQELTAGTLLLIERGETHEIRNSGDSPLKTINIYAPPAY